MSTLDSLVQEMILRNQAAGRAVTIAADASENAKLAFIQSFMKSPEISK